MKNIKIMTAVVLTVSCFCALRAQDNEDSYACAAPIEKNNIFVKNVSEIPGLALKKVTFEDKKALIEEIETLVSVYLDRLNQDIISNASANLPKDSCEQLDNLGTDCLFDIIQRIYYPEIFDKNKIDDRLSDFLYLGLDKWKTKKEFLKNAKQITADYDKQLKDFPAKYNAAFNELSEVFVNLKQTFNAETIPENKIEDLNKSVSRMTEEERSDKKKLIVFIVTKTKIPEIFENLKDPVNSLFRYVKEGDTQKAQVMKDTIDSLIKIERERLDKDIKKRLKEAGLD